MRPLSVATVDPLAHVEVAEFADGYLTALFDSVMGGVRAARHHAEFLARLDTRLLDRQRA